MEELYRQHVGAVFRFALRSVGRRDLAEDLTGEAFLALDRSSESIDTKQLPGWLLTVVRNRAIDFWRRGAKERQDLPGTSADPVTSAAAEPEMDLLRSEVLKPIHRACLVLRYAHGMTFAEVAHRTGLSEMQVKGHLHYARQLLRTESSQREAREDG